MGTLSDDLKELGYDRTERESPFDENGTLWENSYELVCDETAYVISKDSPSVQTRSNGSEERVYRYQNSGKVKLMGGFPSSYDWGRDSEEGRFTYDLKSSQ